jgi:hypothetical protein
MEHCWPQALVLQPAHCSRVQKQHIPQLPEAFGDANNVTGPSAAALGLSLNQLRQLLALLLPGKRCPSRARLGRWVAAARQAGRVLQALDAACPVYVRTACLDEIYCHRQPVFVAVEPHSMTWIVGQRVASCSGDTWHQTLQPWTFLGEKKQRVE